MIRAICRKKLRFGVDLQGVCSETLAFLKFTVSETDGYFTKENYRNV